MPSLVAVMMAVPSRTPVTRPLPSTVATAGSELLQVTLRSSTFPPSSFGVALSWRVWPISTVPVPGATSTVATGIVTVTSVLLPSQVTRAATRGHRTAMRTRRLNGVRPGRIGGTLQQVCMGFEWMIQPSQLNVKLNFRPPPFAQRPPHFQKVASGLAGLVWFGDQVGEGRADEVVQCQGPRFQTTSILGRLVCRLGRLLGR